jgi:hypothetical protein
MASRRDGLWKLTVEPQNGRELIFTVTADRGLKIVRSLANDQTVSIAIGKRPEVLMDYLLTTGGQPSTPRAKQKKVRPDQSKRAFPGFEDGELLEEIRRGLDRTGNHSDVERLTVIATCVVDAGANGLDGAGATIIYKQLGLRVPTRWGAAFSNAKRARYLTSDTRGLWKPTPAGRALALEGKRSPRK